MEASHEIEYKLRELGTRSVTLFPTRAQIFRDIKDVPLKPGMNKISILGLAPTIDKDSVKVEGSGLAVITDISVVKESNPDSFTDIYPEFDMDPLGASAPPESTEPEVDKALQGLQEIPQLKDYKQRLESAHANLKAAREDIESADARLKILDNFGKGLVDKKDTSPDIGAFMETYNVERASAFKSRQKGERNVRVLQSSIDELQLQVDKYHARQDHERQMAHWEKEQAGKEEAKAKKKESERQEKESLKKQRRRHELLGFWPKYVYNVCITLDASPYTPGSSRRNSTTSDIEPAKASPASKTEGSETTMHCDLLLSYVTTSAFWAPSYDMQLSTTSATGTLLFDAQLHNSTSETWADCHVTLSTSQATATSIDEPIPSLVPWHIRLLSGDEKSKASGDDISLSKEERSQKSKYHKNNHPETWNKDRSLMFHSDSSSNANLQDYQMQMMLLEQQNKKRLEQARQNQSNQRQQLMMQQAQQLMMQQPQQQGMQQPQQQGMQHTNRLFGGYNSADRDRDQASRGPASGGLFGAAPYSSNTTAVFNDFDFDGFRSGDNGDQSFGSGPDFNDGETMREVLPALDFKDSLIEETGLTTAYDLPGTKTLAPGGTSSKHRVARLSLSNILFNYTIVPKYKPVAYLKAKIRNGSKLTLLRGNLGLTLDGSFMGRTALPRCSAGETLTLGLGIDPAVRVVYPGPDVRRATTGLFSKEDSSAYTRSVTLENTRSSTSSKPVTIFVHDQVPVSEDERLKVEIQVPRGLKTNGGAVATGVPGSTGAEGKNWGEATAITKNTGTVTWQVKLNPGKSARLDLEYIVAMPSGSGLSAVSLK